MLRARAEPAELPLPQDAPHGTFRNLNIEAVLDLDFQIAAAPAHHAVLDRVRLGIHNLVQFQKLALVKQRFAAWVRAVRLVVVCAARPSRAPYRTPRRPRGC